MKTKYHYSYCGLNLFRANMKYLLFSLLIIIVCFSGLLAKERDYVFSFNPNSDYWPTESWLKTAPEKQGMNSKALCSLLEEVNSKNVAINSILVIRNGYIVLETNKGDIDQPRPLYSSTKSVTSAIIGLAITQGIINSPDQSIDDFFQFPSSDPSRQEIRNITLSHLLTMSSGADWPELSTSYMHPKNPVYQMHMSSNWVEFILKRRLVSKPGTRFNYNSGCSHLLIAALTKTGINVENYAYENLFKPLGILKDQYVWSKDPQNIPNGSHGLVMKPRDMAKIGYLYLKGGVWEGKQLISKQWITESTKRQIEINWGGKIAKYYGYQWYIQPYGFHSLGYNGQYIFILPDQNLVAVFTSELSTYELEIPIKLFECYIVAAIESDKKLPANAKALDQLLQQTIIFNDNSN
jgi:CubicO group peptidase (beta-lactamase class C family)